MSYRIAFLLGLIVTMSCAVAHAGDGAVLRAAQFNQTQRSELEMKVAKAKRQYPNAFSRIRRVKGHQPLYYKRFRSQKPSILQELRALGPGAGWAIIDAISFDSFPRARASASEWRAVQRDLVIALGELKMVEAGLVLQKVFDDTDISAEVVEAAAIGMGKLGGIAQRAALMKAIEKPGKKQHAALWGLRHVRAIPIVEAIAPLLHSSDERTVVLAANALGFQGSSWAWNTGHAGDSREQMPLRLRCMNALLQAYLPNQSEAREAIARALTMVQHPDTMDKVNMMLTSAPSDQDKKALEKLKTLLSMSF